MVEWRRILYEIIEPLHQSKWSKMYDCCMLVIIIASIIPLTIRQNIVMLDVLDNVTVSVFILDYLIRWITADYKYPQYKKWKTFVLYPFTPIAIIDLLSILPSFSICNRAFKLFRITRLLKVLRVFRFIRYSRNILILIRVLQKEKRVLLVVLYVALGYIFISALIMFNSEESSMFTNFFDALYWAATTLTTVGYGDVYPLTNLGKVISMFSSLFGVAIIALPSGVITASYLEELREQKK